MKSNFIILMTLLIAAFSACYKIGLLPEDDPKVQVDDRTNAPTDLCATTFCPPNSICINGQCECDTGWEGLACSKGYSDKFVGSYHEIDSCELGIYVILFTIEIIKIDNQNVKILNFGGFGQGNSDPDVILGKIEKTNQYSSSAQKLIIDGYDQSGLHFEATGILKDTIILGTYKVTYPDDYMETCQFKLTKM